MNTKLQKWGNSYGIRIPINILKELEINEGDSFKIFVYNNGIRLVKENDASIEEMLENYNNDDYTEWDIDDVKGREVW